MKGFGSHARSDGIRLLPNEWETAHHFVETIVSKKGRRNGVVWLYVVTEAGTEQPELHRIQHPASHFREEDIFATVFVVHEEAWRSRVQDLPDRGG